MKRALTITVVFIYLIISSGLVLQIHYCMGKAIGSCVQFAETGATTCSTCGMENGKNKCCHDEVKLLKLQDAQKQVNTDYQVPAPEMQPHQFNFIDPIIHFNTGEASSCNDNSPPDDDSGQPSLFILHSLFRI